MDNPPVLSFVVPSELNLSSVSPLVLNFEYSDVASNGGALKPNAINPENISTIEFLANSLND